MAKMFMEEGDLYCIEMKGEYKLFFHYLGNDRSCMGGAVIRVFSKRYDMDYVPDVKEIIKGDVMFYAHAFISDGIEAGVWYKVGNSKDLCLDKLSEVWFGKTLESIHIPADPPFDIVDIDRLRYWQLWKYNEPIVETDGEYPEEGLKLYSGLTYSYSRILEYAELGYYRDSAVEYEIIKRMPHEYANNYVRLKDYDLEYLFNFRGEEIVREIVLGNGESVSLYKESPESGVLRLNDMKFWEINWKEEDFISAEEFENLWKV